MKSNWRKVFAEETQKLEFPKEHEPFMESKEGFSCSVCKYFKEKDKTYYCRNPYFIKWQGDDKLNIEDLTKWCSDWFEPKHNNDIHDSIEKYEKA